MSAERQLAAAMRARALSDTGVKAVLGNPARIYDEPPRDALFPYATLGRVETEPAESAGSGALEHALTLHVWSRYGGRAEALDAIGALREALHDAPLALDGRKLVILFATFCDVFRAGDGRTTHGVIRFRAITEPD